MQPPFRNLHLNARGSLVVAMFSGVMFAVISLRLIDHGLAFGRWVAQQVR